MLKNRTVTQWLGLVLVLAMVFMFTGCCARLQSPIVFDQCCGGGWGGCYNSCWDNCGSCNTCNPCGSPCNPGYSQ